MPSRLDSDRLRRPGKEIARGGKPKDSLVQEILKRTPIQPIDGTSADGIVRIVRKTLANS